MHIEVDQSGKIGDTRVPTVLAFSNSENCAILIPASVKRACIQRLRKRGKSGTTLYLQLFATGLYLLLKGYIQFLQQVTIDIEYPGHSAKIKEHFLNLLHRSDIIGIDDKIVFQFIGKKSKAHEKAIRVFNGVIEPDKTIGYQDIMAEF